MMKRAVVLALALLAAATFYEHYACNSPRSYSGYCDPEITRLIEAQSQELDRGKRLALVHTAQRKLAEAASNPVLCWRLDYFTIWPHVKNLVPHHSIYGWGRLQDVWLDPTVSPRP
jgi:peptide/nickel transport system substrate-binding protein